MLARALPTADEMFTAMATRNPAYDGIFYTGVRTTGIFCRPTCPARKPLRRNVDFFATAAAAMAHGFRPCQRCRPLERPGDTPEWVRALLAEVEAAPMPRLRDRDVRARGHDPAALRRWFKRHHGITFQAYQRARRLGSALGALTDGATITRAAFDSGYESVSGFSDAVRRLTGRSPARSRDATVVHLSRVVTPVGPMLLGATADGVCLLEFTDRPMLETQLRRLEQRLRCAFIPGSTDAGRQLEGELEDYFAGTLTSFATPLALSGSDFQRGVWTALREIPYGETRSYLDQARALSRPEAVRAVARANGDNRIAIVIPCHRVVGAGGALTGYGGGLWRKEWLLHHERAVAARSQAHSPNIAVGASPVRSATFGRRAEPPSTTMRQHRR